MDSCVSYFNKLTQNDIPVRQSNKYGNLPDNDNPLINNIPQNSWVETETATEYACMGINIVPSNEPGVTGYSTSYMSLDDWKSTWAQGGCVDLFNTMLLGETTKQGAAAWSTNAFYLVQDDFNFMFSRYFNQDPDTQYQGPQAPCGSTGGLSTYGNTGGKISNADNDCNVWIGGQYSLVIPGQVGLSGAYDSFLDTLLDACTALPGVCSQMQTYMCGECDRAQVSANPALVRFCGCYTAKQSKGNGNAFYNSTLPNYDYTCDPLCNRDNAVREVNTNTGISNTCSASLCVIDAVTINSISSSGVTPTFNQVCPACINGQGNCICIIDATFNSTIPSVKTLDGSSIDNQIKFTQYCPNSQCFIADPNTGAYTQVECLDTLPKGTGPSPSVPWWVFVVAIIVLIFAIVIMLAYKYAGDTYPAYYTGTVKYDVPFVAKEYMYV
jgi:hypothetical protein